MDMTSATVTKQNKAFNLASQTELERTSDSVSGTPAVAVSGINGEGSGEPENFPGIPATNKGGGGGGLPLLDNSVISARSRSLALSQKRSFWQEEQNDKNGKTSRRVRRFYQRYFTGVGVGGSLRILTLTTSDEALSLGKDIHKSFRALVMRLRRRYGRFEYIGVVETKGVRQHLHMVFRGSYMQQALISAMWQKIHQSKVVDIRAIRKTRGGVCYLAKYLAKETVNRYWASYNWVFKGWCGWSKRVKRIVGNYPSKTLLCGLARLDKATRLGILAYWNSWLDNRADWFGIKT